MRPLDEDEPPIYADRGNDRAEPPAFVAGERPTLAGESVMLLKSTALASTVAVTDLLGAANLVRAQTLKVYEPLLVVACVGAATAFVAASIGLTQRDIKKVLAYSTVSHLGFMFLALGMGAYAAGIFHVFTHAFFKGCLFLCAGSVIHGMSGEQDMFKMGALKKKMPITYATYFISCLAIAGIPPFSGFFSKDEILWKTWEHGHFALWGVGVAAAPCTKSCAPERTPATASAADTARAFQSWFGEGSADMEGLSPPCACSAIADRGRRLGFPVHGLPAERGVGDDPVF